jgi:hypothetical protein
LTFGVYLATNSKNLTILIKGLKCTTFLLTCKKIILFSCFFFHCNLFSKKKLHGAPLVNISNNTCLTAATAGHTGQRANKVAQQTVNSKNSFHFFRLLSTEGSTTKVPLFNTSKNICLLAATAGHAGQWANKVSPASGNSKNFFLFFSCSRHDHQRKESSLDSAPSNNTGFPAAPVRIP